MKPPKFFVHTALNVVVCDTEEQRDSASMKLLEQGQTVHWSTAVLLPFDEFVKAMKA